MKITLTLNDEPQTIEAESDETLLSLLRRLHYNSVKCGCEKGFCGNCMVLMDDEPVKSCKVPAGILRDTKIVTLEHFRESSYYPFIKQGLDHEEIDLCGYCNSGKIFTAYSILKRTGKIDREIIERLVKGLGSCCSDTDTFINAIIYAKAQMAGKGEKFNGQN